jgi:acetyl/propionyl-CoA carboxylase alpha subunit
MTDRDWYAANPEITGDRRLGTHASAWVRSFACEDVRPLVICRGPIRKEALDVFAEMGISHAGILLSEKDSIVYTNALAPELRGIAPEHVHRVRDYSGATKAEREERLAEIVAICRKHGYTHVFAGYGFMSEDEALSGTLERSGIVFIGPRSRVQAAAGKKDEAKRTALREGVTVTPGIDDATTRLILRKHPSLEALRAVVRERGLAVPAESLADGADLRRAAEQVLDASYAARLDLYDIDELAAEIERAAASLFEAHPGQRVRLKAIGGGGGKGQRILAGITKEAADTASAARQAAEAAPGAVREILSEVKATGVGDDKNIVLELNIEETRHNEIQLLGNGQWCVSLGGRDCSAQMHEQKLLEISVTQEGLRGAIEAARAEGRSRAAAALADDLATLVKMEAEAERFGLAVGLNSASTFECIVNGGRGDTGHYFMEVNTRIQVEHRVSELCYALRFTNPDDASDAFEVRSIVEAMVLIARHGARLPRPTRVPRHSAAVESRLNATDRSLAPHAGGLIQSWTSPVEHEIRDDQGICVKNPDTGVFVHYRLAGAYDSNIALLVTYGQDRRESYVRLLEILRRMKLRGVDLQTNNAFHYGLVHWFLSQDVWAKPTTRFVLPYLAQVGLLAAATQEIDLDLFFQRVGASLGTRAAAAGGEPGKAALAATRKVLQLKETLLRRPLDAIFEEPHVLSAWLSRNRRSFRVEGEGPAARVVWTKNPLEVLEDTYWLLNMDARHGAPAAHVIWEHDQALLQRGLGFYRTLQERLGLEHGAWEALVARLAAAEAPSGFDDASWGRVRASHAGFQLGLEVLALLPLLGVRTGFYELRVEDDLFITIPARLLDKELQTKMRKVLAPPPRTQADRIVAVSGGMFYAQEAPHLPPLVTKGSHFVAGQPLYVIEVMKMFNKVLAPFAGTVDEILVSGDGTIVQKGQPLYRVTPDEQIVEESEADRARRLAASTSSYIEALLG